MRGFNTFGVIAFAAGLAVTTDAGGAEFDGSAPFLCAPLKVMSCETGAECSAETAESINLPQFLRVNTSEGAITGTRPDGEALSTPIMRRQSDDGRLVLQGVENQLSWTISIDEAAGNMTIVAAGDKVAFVAFGACARP